MHVFPRILTSENAPTCNSVNDDYRVLTIIKLERYLSYCILCFVVTHTIVVVVVVVVENESDRVTVGPDRAIVGLSLGSETGSFVHNKILEYEAECL